MLWYLGCHTIGVLLKFEENRLTWGVSTSRWFLLLFRLWRFIQLRWWTLLCIVVADYSMIHVRYSYIGIMWFLGVSWDSLWFYLFVFEILHISGHRLPWVRKCYHQDGGIHWRLLYLRRTRNVVRMRLILVFHTRPAFFAHIGSSLVGTLGHLYQGPRTLLVAPCRFHPVSRRSGKLILHSWINSYTGFIIHGTFCRGVAVHGKWKDWIGWHACFVVFIGDITEYIRIHQYISFFIITFKWKNFVQFLGRWRLLGWVVCWYEKFRRKHLYSLGSHRRQACCVSQ